MVILIHHYFVKDRVHVKRTFVIEVVTIQGEVDTNHMEAQMVMEKVMNNMEAHLVDLEVAIIKVTNIVVASTVEKTILIIQEFMAKYLSKR